MSSGGNNSNNDDSNVVGILLWIILICATFFFDFGPLKGIFGRTAVNNAITKVENAVPGLSDLARAIGFGPSLTDIDNYERHWEVNKIIEAMKTKDKDVYVACIKALVRLAQRGDADAKKYVIINSTGFSRVDSEIGKSISKIVIDQEIQNVSSISDVDKVIASIQVIKSHMSALDIQNADEVRDYVNRIYELGKQYTEIKNAKDKHIKSMKGQVPTSKDIEAKKVAAYVKMTSSVRLMLLLCGYTEEQVALAQRMDLGLQQNLMAECSRRIDRGPQLYNNYLEGRRELAQFDNNTHPILNAENNINADISRYESEMQSNLNEKRHAILSAADNLKKIYNGQSPTYSVEERKIRLADYINKGRPSDASAAQDQFQPPNGLNSKWVCYGGNTDTNPPFVEYYDSTTIRECTHEEGEDARIHVDILCILPNESNYYYYTYSYEFIYGRDNVTMESGRLYVNYDKNGRRVSSNPGEQRFITTDESINWAISRLRDYAKDFIIDGK